MSNTSTAMDLTDEELLNQYDIVREAIGYYGWRKVPKNYVEASHRLRAEIEKRIAISANTRHFCEFLGKSQDGPFYCTCGAMVIDGKIIKPSERPPEYRDIPDPKHFGTFRPLPPGVY